MATGWTWGRDEACHGGSDRPRQSLARGSPERQRCVVHGVAMVHVARGGGARGGGSVCEEPAKMVRATSSRREEDKVGVWGPLLIFGAHKL